MPLRVGLVTSVGSAAEADFVDELRRSGFAFDVGRVDARVQGLDAELDIVAAHRAGRRRRGRRGVLVRGGGARTDLAAFDDERIARAIATCPVPVLTGIGHEVDRSVADEVAHTPTRPRRPARMRSCSGCGRSSTAIEGRWHAIATLAARATRDQAEIVEAAGARVGRAAAAAGWPRPPTGTTAGASGSAAPPPATSATPRPAPGAGSAPLPAGARGRSPRPTGPSASIEARLRALDPERTLARGWSITRTADGRVVRSPDEVAPGDELLTQVAAGTVRSTVAPTSTVDADG